MCSAQQVVGISTMETSTRLASDSGTKIGFRQRHEDSENDGGIWCESSCWSGGRDSEDNDRASSVIQEVISLNNEPHPVPLMAQLKDMETFSNVCSDVSLSPL